MTFWLLGKLEFLHYYYCYYYGYYYYLYKYYYFVFFPSSGDSTARIWNMNENHQQATTAATGPGNLATMLPASSTPSNGASNQAVVNSNGSNGPTATGNSASSIGSAAAVNQLVLRHCIQRGGAEVPSNKDVTSLDWNVSSCCCCLLLFVGK